GKVDILVNNAGITKDGLILRMDDAEWDAVLNVNLKGTFNCTRAVSRAMIKQRAGKIINIASIIGIIGNAGQANYSASKAGIIALTKTTARELASRNINVNAVAPGFIQTEMTAKLPEELKQKMLGAIPLGKFGNPADVAATCVFLASEEASYITGQTLIVDGGMVMV
ncbi:MAG: SDR family oxidoreductase, partial [Candidatus Omnitrophota bacterium]